jgi:hypothetical protein
MIELDLLKEALGGGFDESDDALLQEYERAAVALVEEKTRAHFGTSATVVEIVNGTGSTQLTLNNDPASITTVEVRGKWGDAPPFDNPSNVWSTVGATNYLLKGNRLIYLLGRWPVSENNIRITYVAGYTANQQPPIIRKAVIDIVGHWFRNRPMLRSTEDTDAPNIPMSAVALLEAWMGRYNETPILPRLRRA